MAKAAMYVANTSGAAEVDGVEYSFNVGISRFAGDHPLVKACPLFFEPVDGEPAPVVEAATQAPGEKRA